LEVADSDIQVSRNVPSNATQLDLHVSGNESTDEPDSDATIPMTESDAERAYQEGLRLAARADSPGPQLPRINYNARGIEFVRDRLTGELRGIPGSDYRPPAFARQKPEGETNENTPKKTRQQGSSNSCTPRNTSKQKRDDQDDDDDTPTRPVQQVSNFEIALRNLID
jgi:hypothetical protein